MPEFGQPDLEASRYVGKADMFLQAATKAPAAPETLAQAANAYATLALVHELRALRESRQDG
jgi:hypothetical protein